MTANNAEKTDERLQKRLVEMADFLDQAQANLDQKKDVELGDMKSQINALCADIEGASPATAHAMKPIMADIIAKLDQLADSLNAFKTEMKSAQNNG